MSNTNTKITITMEISVAELQKALLPNGGKITALSMETPKTKKRVPNVRKTTASSKETPTASSKETPTASSKETPTAKTKTPRRTPSAAPKASGRKISTKKIK